MCGELFMTLILFSVLILNVFLSGRIYDLMDLNTSFYYFVYLPASVYLNKLTEFCEII